MSEIIKSREQKKLRLAKQLYFIGLIADSIVGISDEQLDGNWFCASDLQYSNFMNGAEKILTELGI